VQIGKQLQQRPRACGPVISAVARAPPGSVSMPTEKYIDDRDPSDHDGSIEGLISRSQLQNSSSAQVCAPLGHSLILVALASAVDCLQRCLQNYRLLRVQWDVNATYFFTHDCNQLL